MHSTASGLRHSAWIAATTFVMVLTVLALCQLATIGAPVKGHVSASPQPLLNMASDTFIADDFCLEVWRNNRMPLKVYFHPGDNVAGYDAKFKQSFIDACEGLSSAADNKVSFQVIDTEAGADIDVRWIASKSEKLWDKRWSDAIGICSRTVCATDGTVEHASIYLLTKPDYASANKYGRNFMQETCLHELGHACGLGHSLRKGDVMYKQHSTAKLEDGTLELASEPHFTSRDSASLKLMITAQNNIIKVIESSNAKAACVQFNNEAFRLIRAGDNGQALIYLRAALESDSSNTLAMQNAMVALFNCACDLNNTRHWSEALPILEKSIKLAKKVGSSSELNQMLGVQRNCLTQVAQERKASRG